MAGANNAAAGAPPRADDPAVATRLQRLFVLGCAAVIGANFAAAFIGLDASSLWIDELYTSYFTDPALSWLEFLRRASEDVHPPVYYGLIYAIRQFGGDFTIVARGASAVLAIATVVVLYVATAGELSRAARLFMGAFAVTTGPWYYYAQEARSYALTFVLIAALIGIGIRYLRNLDAGRANANTLVALAVLAVLGAFTHIYILMVAGAMLGFFLLLARDWAGRAAIVATGVAILIPVLVYLPYKMGQIVAPEVESADVGFLLPQLGFGMRKLAGSYAGVILLPLLTVIAAVTLLRQGGRVVMTNLGGFLGLTTVVPAAAIALTVATSLLFIGGLPLRITSLLVPFVWAYVGLTFDYATRSNRLAPFVTMFCLLVVAANSYRMLYRYDQRQENWRDSAHYVGRLAACRNAEIPVAVFDAPRVKENEGQVFYGYYLDSPRRFLPVPNGRLISGELPPRWLQLVQERVNNRGDCPVLLWSAHHMMRGDLDRLKRATLGAVTMPPGRTLEVLPFDQRVFTEGNLLSLQLAGRTAKAFVLIVRDVAPGAGGTNGKPTAE